MGKETRDEEIVFAVLVSWTGSQIESWKAVDEYERFEQQLRDLSPGATPALFFGSRATVSGGVDYNAVALFRWRVTTAEAVKECVRRDYRQRCWLELGPVRVLEPRKGQKLEQFLVEVQDYCSGGDSTCGERILLQPGDEETQRMLEESDDRKWMSDVHRNINRYRSGLDKVPWEDAVAMESHDRRERWMAQQRLRNGI